MSKVKHIPWQIAGVISGYMAGYPAVRRVYRIRYEGYGGYPIADVPDAEHAELIVRAVNAHDDLLQALEVLQWSHGHYDDGDSEEPFLRTCPSCAGPDRPDYMGPAGHFPDCQLAKALAKGKGEDKEVTNGDRV